MSENKSREISNRIKISVAAYAYEFEDDSIMSDGDFDALALKIDPKVSTGNKKMDRFFKETFSPHTGQWIHKHPEIEGIKRIYLKHYKKEV